MNAPSDSRLAPVARSIPVIAVDRRLARAIVASLVIGGYVALGFTFRLGADGYLLVGVPITIAFQVLVVRRPLRTLWLRDAPRMVRTPRLLLAVVVVAIAQGRLPSVVSEPATRS